MALQNDVSIQISESEMIEIQNAVKTLETKLLPLLITLSPQDRRNIVKMGDGRLPFVRKTLNYVESNPEFAPKYLDLAELKKDTELVNQLLPVFHSVQKISDGLDDTLMAAGSEAYVASLSYYNGIKQAVKDNIQSAKTIFADLKQTFERTNNSGEATDKQSK
ncbi:MAG: hypothetical protein GXX85_08895 [Ignavibacteria bacterium]|nr:hypothetical protein [Ignavibacteria bacterium]